MSVHQNEGPSAGSRVSRRQCTDTPTSGIRVAARMADELPVGVPAALNTHQASLYTGLAPATLEGLRSKGGGPRYVRYGRKAVRYLMSDLDEWIRERTIASTSEL